MFDKLIVSEPARADIKNRRSYFLLSSLVVGVLFLTAVVFSIYAADYGLGDSGFDLVEIVMPPDMAATVAPEPEVQSQRTQASNDRESRVINMSRPDEPTVVPTGTSAIPNVYMARPRGVFDITPTDSAGPGISDREAAGGGPLGTGIAQSPRSADLPDVGPPPVAKSAPKTKPTVSKGPLNGVAKSLPKPIYSAAARAVRAQGSVAVQVTIDETGKVISAHAVSGPMLLRADSEKAALNARFSPTLLGDVPVKVTGIITYNFVL